MFDVLIRSREFWAAVILLLSAVINWVFPTIPKEVSSSFLALLGIIAGLLAGAQVNAARLASKARLPR